MARTGILRNWEAVEVTFAAGASISSSAIQAGRALAGMIMSADWTPASLLFQVAGCANGTWHGLRSDDDRSYLAMPVSGSCAIAACSVLDRIMPFYGLRLLSGSVKTGAIEGVPQGSPRSLVFFWEG